LRCKRSSGKATWPHRKQIWRGFRPTIDSYSASYENDRKTRTGLAGYLRERGRIRLFRAGLALDFCVRYSAEDGVGDRFTTMVIADARRGIDFRGSIAEKQRSFATAMVASIEGGVFGQASSVAPTVGDS